MSLIQYQPWNTNTWSTLNNLRGQLNQLIGMDNLAFDEEQTDVATSAWRPSVDIKEEDDRYVFLADIRSK